MKNPLTSSRAEAFPAGLRVLIVDDDPTWLKILEKMLRKCSYEVTTCSLATDALNMLREKRDGFDIVISDVNMPDMDGFKLLEHVGLEMDLPVIMMSIDGEISRVMKGVQHGACDYLLKPVRMKELRNIWQHVYRKKMHELREIDTHSIHEDVNIQRHGPEDLGDRHLIGGNEMSSTRKRKDVENKEFGDQELDDPSTMKKARVVWSVDLHQRFVNAVNQIGFEKVGPKKILDLMNVPGLTRENVASHLQKYRLYLSRLPKQNEGRISGGNLPSDLTNNGSTRNFGVKSSSIIQLGNELTKFVSPTGSFQTEGIIADPAKGTKGIEPAKAVERKKAPVAEPPCSQKVNNMPQLGVLLSFKGMMPSVKEKEKPCELTTSKHKPPPDGAPRMQFMQFADCSFLSNLEADHEPSSSLPSIGNFSSSLPSIVTTSTTTSEKDMKDVYDMKPILTDNINGHFIVIPPVACMIDSVALQVKHGIVNAEDLGAICKLQGSPSINDRYIDDNPCNIGCFPLTCEFSLQSETEISFPEDLQLCAVQKIGCLENVSFSGTEFYQYIDAVTPTTEVQSIWYGTAELNSEYQYDSVDYPPFDDYPFA